MGRTIQEQLDLLDETVKYYSEDVTRRGFNEELKMCEYKTDEGKMCAVGRCIDQNVMDYDKYNRSTTAKMLISKIGQNIFKEEYRGFSFELWRKLQDIHDSWLNWNQNGITNRGMGNVSALRAQIKKGCFNNR